MPPSAWEQVAQTLLEHVQRADAAVEEIRDLVRTETANNQLTRQELSNKVKQVDKALTELKTTIRGTNGKDSLIMRLAAVEGKVKSLQAHQGEPPSLWRQILVQSSPLWIGLILVAIGWFIYLIMQAGWTP